MPLASLPRNFLLGQTDDAIGKVCLVWTGTNYVLRLIGYPLSPSTKDGDYLPEQVVLRARAGFTGMLLNITARTIVETWAFSSRSDEERQAAQLFCYDGASLRPQAFSLMNIMETAHNGNAA